MMPRLYRVLLHIAPRRLREAHGDDMAELFADRLRAARRRGTLAVAAVWLRAISDLCRARFWPASPERVPLTVFIDERTSFMLGSDVRFAWRALMQQRGASVLALLMLALGIAANVAVFSIVNGLFLRPFPFPEPDRLVYINTAAPKWNLELVGINYPDFDRWQRDQKLFVAITMYQTADFNLADANGAERIRGVQITYDFPRVFGVTPILGRSFSAEEDRPKATPVVLLGEALWRERFGADPQVIGRSLRLDGVTRTIIGVMPYAASFPDGARLLVPYEGDPAQPYESYSGDGIGRLKPGVTPEQGDADIKRAHQPIWDNKDKERVVTPFVRPLHDMVVRDYRVAARGVTGAVAVLLLIACANVAAVMLARALARRREMGIRLALGSSRLRLVRQLLIENLILAAIGGVIGVLAGQWALGALMQLIPDQLPRWAAFHVDARVLAFSVLTVLATVVLFGWAPALHAIGGDLRSAVNTTTNNATVSPRGRRTLRLIVAGEFALAALLLVSGGLLFKAFDKIRSVDPGFRVDGAVVATIPLSEGTRPKQEQWLAFWTDFERRLAAVPGVDAAGLVTCAPMAGCHNGNFFQVDGAIPSPDGKNPVILTRSASPGYFRAIGLRLKEGRFLEDADGTPQSDGAVVVNETFVRTFWGAGASGAGRRIKFRDREARWIPVVGVVEDVKHYGLDRPMRPGVYFPLGKRPRSTMMAVVHASVPPASIVPAVREVLRQMDPEVPLFRARPMEDHIRRSTALRAALSWMLAVFASLAFVLAIGGAYGVSTYLVTQRTREIGIRVALGARTGDIFRHVAATGVAVVLAGVACGLAASVAVMRLMGDALFGVSARDATVFGGVTAVLVATALLANGLPARRAARIDPMRSLRTDG